MNCPAMRRLGMACLTSLCLAVCLNAAQAAPPGVETRVRTRISGAERARQPDIWAVEVYYKSLRMIVVPLPDPETGELRKEIIWYLPYRIVNRLEEGHPEPTAPDGGRPRFVPEFELVTNDNDGSYVYTDVVIPAAQAAINKREGRTEKDRYKNSVEIVGRIPEPTPADAKLEKSIYGVAMWRGVDSKTDFFKIFMSGFSNGFVRVNQDRIDRRTIVQEYRRPGDELEQMEVEIKPVGRPVWIYRPSEDKAPVADQ